MEAMQKPEPEVISSLVLNGDLSKLTPTQKVQYYNAMCQRLGLDPLGQPFKLLKLNGKEVMYCDRSGAQQLNKIHNVSHAIQTRETLGDVYVVTARASIGDQRFTDSLGAVSISGLKGDALANAMMKAETKAKRRSTLDLLGLGMLDETEVETIPNAVPLPPMMIEMPEQVENAIGEEIQQNFSRFEEIVVPMGPNKGKKMTEVGFDVLEKQLTWLSQHPDKHPEYREAVQKFLDDPFCGSLNKKAS